MEYITDFYAFPAGDDLLEITIKDFSQFNKSDFCKVNIGCQIVVFSIKYTINPPKTLAKDKIRIEKSNINSLRQSSLNAISNRVSIPASESNLDVSSGSSCSYHTAQSSLSQASSTRSSLDSGSENECQKTPTRTSFAEDEDDDLDPGTLKKSSTPISNSATTSPSAILNQTFESQGCDKFALIPQSSNPEVPQLLNVTFHNDATIKCDLDNSVATPCIKRPISNLKRMEIKPTEIKSSLKPPNKLPVPTIPRRTLQPINSNTKPVVPDTVTKLPGSRLLPPVTSAKSSLPVSVAPASIIKSKLPPPRVSKLPSAIKRPAPSNVTRLSRPAQKLISPRSRSTDK